MRKIIFLIATTALLCGCNKITIEESEIAGSYWYKDSYYFEYIDENGKKVRNDSKDYYGMDGIYTPSIWWYFGNNAEFITYVHDYSVSLCYYKTKTYKFDLEANLLITENGEDTIIKFTDKELIVEGIGGSYGNYTTTLWGYRMKRFYPKNGYFDSFIPYEEVPDEYKGK